MNGQRVERITGRKRRQPRVDQRAAGCAVEQAAPARLLNGDIGDRAILLNSKSDDGQSPLVLLPLPAYAPELNPMENVWEYLRGNKLSAGVWDDYDAILETCVDAWNWLIADPERIRSIGMREWMKVNV